MCCHLLTRNLSFPLLCFVLLSLPGVAFAQVYKSYDADGNVIFSDQPDASSEEIEVNEPNVSESFEVPPPTPAPPPPEPEPAAVPETPPEVVEDNPDTNNDGRISRREIDDYRDRQRKKRRAEKKANSEGSEKDWN